MAIRTTVDIPESLHAKLREKAHQTGTSMRALIVQGAETRSLRQAWEIYERWLQDARVEFHPEPHGMDAAFRHATASFDSEPASKWIGDGYLLAFAHRSSATLVTFAKALASLARKQGCRVVVPA